ncbi:MAG TPA: hypothetical protein VIV60_17820 [Polyangiaceae bacterium]
MSKPVSVVAAGRAAAASGVSVGSVAQGAGKSETLLPPAIKGMTLGFVVGVIAIVCLTLLAPSLVRADQGSIVERPTAVKH